MAKVSDGSQAILDAIRTRQVDLVINTPLGRSAISDGRLMRMTARQHGVPLFTTLSAAAAAVNAIRALKTKDLRVRSLQTHHAAEA